MNEKIHNVRLHAVPRVVEIFSKTGVCHVDVRGSLLSPECGPSCFDFCPRKGGQPSLGYIFKQEASPHHFRAIPSVTLLGLESCAC